MNKKYSIILPVRNGGEYVKLCVNSILPQTLTQFNLHILDNNSTDGTREWINSINDDRIIISSSDKSLTIEENWARIVSIPRNEFMTIIGHDDLLASHYLETMDALIKQHPSASLYQSHYTLIDENGNLIRDCLPMDEKQYAHEFLACHFTRTMDSMGTGYMFRSADYDAVNGIPVHYPNLIFADYELWYNLTSLSYKATTLQNCFSYRMHQSLSRTTAGGQYYEAFKQYLLFIQRTMQQSDAVKTVVSRYAKEMLYYYCEKISHGLAKTPSDKRKISVDEFIKMCTQYAQLLIPGQRFEPLSKKKIKIAHVVDSNIMLRKLFLSFKKVYSKPLYR